MLVGTQKARRIEWEGFERAADAWLIRHDPAVSVPAQGATRSQTPRDRLDEFIWEDGLVQQARDIEVCGLANGSGGHNHNRDVS